MPHLILSSIWRDISRTRFTPVLNWDTGKYWVAKNIMNGSQNSNWAISITSLYSMEYPFILMDAMYIFNHRFSTDAAFGAGYFHSIATTDVLKLENGEYVNAKGIGRPQIMAAVTFGAGYQIKMNKSDTLRIFLQYRARAQLSFNDDYVPILPYIQIALGVSLPIMK